MSDIMEPKHKDTDGFWMVYVDGASLPKVKHYDKNVAVSEAERLARREGRTVYILFACEGYKLQEPPVVSFRTV